MNLQKLHDAKPYIVSTEIGPHEMYSGNRFDRSNISCTGINRVETAKKEADLAGANAFIIEYFAGVTFDMFRARFSKLGKNWKLEEVISANSFEVIYSA